MEVFWTTFATVISGMLLFLLSEWIREIIFVPYHEFQQLKAKVSYTLTKYANVYTSPVSLDEALKYPEQKARYDDASVQLRDIASELDGYIERRYRFQPGVPTRDKLYDAARGMTGLSNSLYTYNPQDKWFDAEEKREETIRKCLGLYHKG